MLPVQESRGVRCVVVGAGSPYPSAERFGSCVVVDYDGSRILVDCGPGSTYKMLQSGIEPSSISTLLITHHHFDHTSDVPTLLLSRWESTLGGHTPIHVYGPSGTDRFIDRLVGPDGAFAADIRARQESPLSQAKILSLGGELPRPGLQAVVSEVGPGEQVALPSGWNVLTGEIRHVQPHHESVAYRVEVGGKTVVVTGDGEIGDALVDLSRDADVVFAMSGSLEASVRARGLASGQMWARTAGQLAERAGVKTLVLTHTSIHQAQPIHREAAVREAASEFGGEIVFGFEGLSLTFA